MFYNRYGGRGISICDDWLNNPMSFYMWSIENGYSPGLQIDRIDNNIGYFPHNCRWTTKTINARNTSRSKIWDIKGLTFSSCAEAAKYFFVNEETIRNWCYGHETKYGGKTYYYPKRQDCSSRLRY